MLRGRRAQNEGSEFGARGDSGVVQMVALEEIYIRRETTVARRTHVSHGLLALPANAIPVRAVPLPFPEAILESRLDLRALAAVSDVTNVRFPPGPRFGQDAVHEFLVTTHVHRGTLGRNAHSVRSKSQNELERVRQNRSYSNELTNSPFSCDRLMTVTNDEGTKQFMQIEMW